LKEVFAEPRQLCNLLLSGHIEDIFDKDIRGEFYPSVSINLLVRILMRHKPVGSSGSGSGGKLTSMMSRFFKKKKGSTGSTGSTGTGKWRTKKNKNHSDSLDSDTLDCDVNADGSTTIVLPPPMSKKEAEQLAMRIDKELLQKGNGKHGKTYDV
jgi:hypothetical protein|tara:strand:+ start:132 stop:593 length:462 start_codon:yes stop_codon:yes gene_type:complete